MGIIRFPNLGFELLVGQSFKIFGFEIAYYGVVIAIAMLAGAAIAYYEAKRTGQSVDDYIDYTLFGIVGGVICARLYYVIFEWDSYKDNLLQIFNIRGGGLAIYGGVIGAVIAAIIFCKVKKIKFFKFADTAVLGLLLGQIIGRWGNFFNREAYGSYTNNIFAMQIPVGDATVVNDNNLVISNGIEFVQVHPTFLYESVLNLLLLALIIIFRDKKKFYGETLLRYFMGYGLIRFFIEGLRSDQLQFHGVAVSQVLSAVLFVAALAVIIVMRFRLKGKPAMIDPIPVRVKGTGKKKKSEEETISDEEKMEFEEYEEEVEGEEAEEAEAEETKFTEAEETEETGTSDTEENI